MNLGNAGHAPHAEMHPVICASLGQLVSGTWVATAVGGEWHCPEEPGDLRADDSMLGRRRTNLEGMPGSASPGQLHHIGAPVDDRDAMQLGHGRINVYKTHGVSIGRDGLPQIQLHIPTFPGSPSADSSVQSLS